MLKDFIGQHFVSQAAKAEGGYVDYGYGQVEPNHLSAQRNGQIYAQLPAAADIEVLEQGQFVKYDYANEVVNFTGPGEWMMVFNEIKLYRDPMQMDCEFAMVKGNYNARVYSPFGYGVDKDGNLTADTMWDRQTRYYNGVDAEGNTSITLTRVDENEQVTYNYDKVTAPASTDPYELHYNEDPFHIEGPYKEKRMPAGTVMVPRVLKTMPGDLYTTNFIKANTLSVGQSLYVGENGILTTAKADAIDDKFAGSGDMVWQVVKVYTMPDHQKGVKLMRIA